MKTKTKEAILIAEEIVEEHSKTIFYDEGDLVALEHNITKCLQEYAEQERWISVEDELPEILDHCSLEVECWLNYLGLNTGESCICSYFGNDIWVHQYKGIVDNTNFKVTHWKRQSQPPKEEEI